MRKRHSPAFKARIVAEALKEEKTITQIASEHEIHPNQISAWKAAALNGLPTLFERESKVQTDHAAHQQQLDELYSQIGRLTTQVTWLKKKSGLDPHTS
jgi:transposase